MPAPQPTTPARILVVDDDPAVRFTLCEALEDAGFVTEAASDGREALARCLQGAPLDLVVTDLVMPGGGGLALIAALREAAPALPVVAITAMVDGRHTAQALAAGARECLAKPFEPAHVVRAARAAIGG